MDGQMLEWDHFFSFSITVIEIYILASKRFLPVVK